MKFMTVESFNNAMKTLDKIKKINNFKVVLCENPMIKSSYSNELVYLSWLDNESNDLKNLLISWCNDEEKRLKEEFNKL